MKELKQKTKWLQEQNEKNWQKYLVNRENQVEFDFYQDMKPFVDHAKELADAFLLEAIPWVNKVRPHYLTEMQLKQCCDNIQMTAVNAFNGKSFYKHFHDHYESSKYTLERVYRSLEEAD